MQNDNPVPAILAIIFSALFLASLGARFWASNASFSITGPTHIASDGNQVFLYLSGEIVELSAEGALIARHGPEATGLIDDPIDMRVMADGSLMLVEQRPARIRRCDAGTWRCQALAADSLKVIHRQLKVLPVEESGRLVMTDAKGDALWEVPMEGGEPRRLLHTGALAGPNDLALDAEGGLWVADTDHRRIVEFRRSDSGQLQTGREHSTTMGLAEGRRFYPIMLARDEAGMWWVTRATEFSDNYADLVIFHPDNGLGERVYLPGGVFAADVARAGRNMLVTDLEAFTVFKVDAVTRRSEPFGDPDFRGLLAGLLKERGRYQGLSRLSFAGMVVFAILAISSAAWATPRGRRWSPRPEAIDLDSIDGTMPAIRGVYWLERDARIDRIISFLEPLIYLTFAISAVGMLFLLAWIAFQTADATDTQITWQVLKVVALLLLAAVLIGGMVLIVRLSVKGFRRRVGTDGHRIHIGLEEGRELSVSPEDVFFNGRAMLYRQYTVPLQTGKQQNLYRKGEVETYLGPLLKRAPMIGSFETLRHQWRHGDPLVLWAAVYVASMLVLAAFVAPWINPVS